MKPEIKKLLILNLPYLLFVWLFDKVGAAVRLSPGADASAKLLHLGDGFTAAFSSIAPSFHPADLALGIADVVTVGALVKYQCSCHFLCHNKILLLWLWVVTGFRPHCMNNSPGRRTAAFSVTVRRLPCHGRQGKCNNCR